MPAMTQPEQPSGLTVLPPQEALRLARPLPDPADLAIEGISDEEWDAFEQALIDR